MRCRSIASLGCVLSLLAVSGTAFAQSPAARPAFPPVQAPPAGGTASTAQPAQAAPPPASAPSNRPNVLERPWTDSADSPYARAQAVAAERLVPETRLFGSSPYPDRYRTPVPAPFRYELASRPWGGVLYPSLPFPAIHAR